MKTEKEKMLSGELYYALDNELSNERLKATLLLEEYNNTKAVEENKRQIILNDLIPNSESCLSIQPPFYCDYGVNMIIGKNVYFNFNCVVLDAALVTIGNRTMFGPNVQIYTASHPIDPKERAKGIEIGKSITIGEDVWVGGNVVICPGVTIGDRTVIGAGSVVTKNVPSDVIAAGNPCKIIKKIYD